MGLVFEGLFALGLVLFVVWLLTLRRSVGHDQAEHEAQQRREQQAREREEREARLYRPGEPLRCLGCDSTFVGPMPDTGCPHCHLATLVVAESDYLAGRQAAQRLADADNTKE